MFRSLEINVTVAWPRAPAPRKGAGRPRLPKCKSAGVTESTIAGPCIWLASFLRTPSRRRNEIRALRKPLLSRVYCPVFFSSGWIRPREAAGRSRHTEKSSPTGDSHHRDRSIGRPRMLRNLRSGPQGPTPSASRWEVASIYLIYPGRSHHLLCSITCKTLGGKIQELENNRPDFNPGQR